MNDTRNHCLDHSEHRSRIDTLEKTDVKQWESITGLQDDIKKIIWSVGTLVGGISILQTIAVAVIVYFMTGKS